jgi:CubicO group peptidase (beta-lactamase class C family)
VNPQLDRGLDTYAASVLAAGSAISLAVAITDMERTLTERVHGPVERSTMFQIGSIGKSFTAITALRLAEAGLVDLHAPVTDLLPWFEVGGQTAPITLHHLLTHTSGLIGGADLATASNYDVVALSGTEVGYAPGAHAWYSNVGFRVVGWSLESASGRPYPELVREGILGPLGMRESEAWIVQEMRPRLAQGYVTAFDDRPWRPEHGMLPATWIDSAEADGCVCTSAGDLAIYLRALMTRDERLLTAGSWEAMFTPHIACEDGEQGDSYGYGIVIGRDDFGHGGGMIGTVSSMLAGDDGLGAVAMLAGYDGASSLSRAALALARGGQPEPFRVELSEPVSDDGSCPDRWRAYVGHYRSHNPWFSNFHVYGHEGGLWWGYDGLDSRREPLNPLDDGRFRPGTMAWSPERLEFDTVIDGRAQRAIMGGLAYHRSFR